MAAALGTASEEQRERLLRVLSAVTFLIFFQAYMVAPLIPRLSSVFGVSSQTIGFIVPAYMIPSSLARRLYPLANVLLQYEIDDVVALPLLFRGLSDVTDWTQMKVT